jgi:hypothetical protein
MTEVLFGQTILTVHVSRDVKVSGRLIVLLLISFVRKVSETAVEATKNMQVFEK